MRPVRSRLVPASGWLTRVLALALVVLGVPLALSAGTLLQEAPVREGEPAPRTIAAPEPVQVMDPEATRRAQNQAAADVEPVESEDDEARAAIVEDVRDAFATLRDVRVAPADGEEPEPEDQVDELASRLPALDEESAERAVELSDDDLDRVANQAEQVAIALAGERIREGEVEEVAQERLASEVATRDFPAGTAEHLVEPIIAEALQPTVIEDEEATEEAREEARDAVEPVLRTFSQGSAVVTAGEPVDEVQMEALAELGLDGVEPWRFLLRALLLSAALAGAGLLYLREYRRDLWSSPRRLLLVALLLLAYAVTLEAVTVLTPEGQSAWLFALPVGAVPMLATILLDPPVGVLSVIPIAALTAFAIPNEPALAAYAAVAGVLSASLVSRLSARGDLRRAAVRSTLGYAALAAAAVTAFDAPEAAPTAAAVALGAGVITAVIVNGSLPFLESGFSVLTATSLLDLADRNHPLLRQLEQQALGTYNHSIMVSQMVERACRAVGADALLASVAALYHDVGKTRRPYFFIENQFGIANPHDDLDPHESADIIRAHVTDGIALGRQHRLPPEIIDGMASHHGTTLIAYFHERARRLHGADAVAEEDFRYPGPKPASREMAILMLADGCESASRATARGDRDLSRDDLVQLVHELTEARIRDGQLDEAALTFADLSVIQESFIETLVGVYHPRIAYPAQAASEADPAKADAPDEGADHPAPDEGAER